MQAGSCASPLHPMIGPLWASGDDAPRVLAPWREHALPSGAMHLVIRLDDSPLRIREADAAGPGTPLRGALVAGVRDRWTLREGTAATRSVGAMIDPAASVALFGVPADRLAGRHVALDDLLGARAAEWVDAILGCRDPGSRIAMLAALLQARLRAAPPRDARLRAQLLAAPGVGEAVRADGRSHRAYIDAFRRETGLSPLAWRRLRRMSAALQRLHAEPTTPVTRIALDGGWADPAHFARDFRCYAGVTPAEYRRQAPTAARHLPIPLGPRASIPF